MSIKKNILGPLKIGFMSLLFILSNNAFATTYYVDAISGSDSNNGTSETQAWKTNDRVSYPHNPYQPGDVISFKRGQTFTDRIYLNGVNGTAENSITFAAYGEGAKPILTVLGTASLIWTNEGNNKWSASSPYTTRLWRNGVEQKRTSNVSFGHAWDEFGGAAGAIWIHDSGKLYYYSVGEPTGTYEIHQKPYAMFIENSSYITIQDLDLRGSSGSVLQIKLSNHCIVKNNVIGKKASSGVWLNTTDHSLVEGNIIDADFTLKYTGMDSYRGTDFRGVSDGVDSKGSYNEIRYNNFINWGHSALQMEGTGLDMAYNNIHHNYFTAKDLEYGRFFAISQRAHNNEIHHNYVEHMKLQSQLSGTDNNLHHNVIVNTTDTSMKSGQEGHAINIAAYTNYPATGNIVEYNTFDNAEGAAVAFIATGQEADDVSGNIVRNNYMHNCGTITDQFRSLYVQNQYPDIRVNTFVGNSIVHDGTTETINFAGNSNNYTVPEFSTLGDKKGWTINSNIAAVPIDDSIGAGNLTLSMVGVNTDGTAVDTPSTANPGAFIMTRGGLN